MGRIKDDVDGVPYAYHQLDEKRIAAYRANALAKFIRHYNSGITTSESTSFGDEIEHTLVVFDHENRRVQLHLRTHELLQQLPENWHGEGTKYQIESMPDKPYIGLKGLLIIEENLRERRQTLQRILSDDEVLLNITVFPRLGCPNFTKPVAPPCTEPSLFLHESVIAPVYRYIYFAKNLNNRCIGPVLPVPVYRDKNTTNHCINADSYHISTGLCCLQTTIQCTDLQQATVLFDQLGALCPVLAALTASTACYNGYLLATDSRLALTMGQQRRYREKNGSLCRWSNITSYISNNGTKFNDLPVPMNMECLQELLSHGVDQALAERTAYILSRDPILVYDREVDEADSANGTVWQTMKLKLPIDGAPWRVEFRPMDVQVSEAENAAFVAFIYLVSRAVLHFGLDLLIPISKLDYNLNQSMKQDSVLKECFYFRMKSHQTDFSNVEKLMTIDEIVNGDGNFIGLIGIVRKYLDDMTSLEADGLDDSESLRIEQYLNFISHRASGKIPTFASQARQFIINHPMYKYDSVVSEEIQYDLLMRVGEVSERTLDHPTVDVNCNV